MRLLITGGGGFVGGNFTRLVLRERPSWEITVFDSLGGGPRPVLDGLASSAGNRFSLVRGAVTDPGAVESLFRSRRFDGVIHFAAKNPSGLGEQDPLEFVEINVVGTAVLLEACRKAWPDGRGKFIHLSSYEVYGSGESGIFTEESGLNPSTPYAASKAAADELTLAYHRTFGLNAMVTRTTNIYGPFQSGDKLIPATARRVAEGREVQIFGSGENLRDWIHVDDHNRGVLLVLEKGAAGQVYHLGARCERTNLEVIRRVARLAARHLGREEGATEKLLRHVEDRAAHDVRRALDPSKAERLLGFSPRVPFEEGLDQTVQWALASRGGGGT